MNNKTFEFDGEKYSKASAHQKEWGNKLIDSLGLSGSERVLDLGCGDGVLTARLAVLVPAGKVLGVDASQGMIDSARKHSLPNLEFRLLDINRLDLEERFDLIFSNAALHWITDHRLLLDNVYRLLAAGGRLRFNFAAEGNCSSFFRVVRQVLREREFEPAFADFVWPWYMPSVDQ